jgi:TonB family protein
MIFDFEDRYFDTPTIEAAMSWREQVMLSVLAHVLVVLLVLFVPQLPFVQEAEALRMARLAELAELQEQAQLALAADENRTFVFIEPRVDFEADQAPNPNAPLSDRDRIAQSPTAAEDPLNNLPNADGNSMRFVESEDPSDALEPDLAAEAAEAPNREEEPAESRFEDASGDVADAETADASRSAEAPREEDGRLSDELVEQLLADGALSLPGGGEPDPDDFDPDADRPADGLLGRAMRNLDRYARRQTFNNQRGRVDRQAPFIQFDSKGADFGPWIRRFVAQVYRNWFMPYAIMSMHGNVVLTFIVHRDGSITDLSVMRPSRVNAFTNSAFNAISTSNPTYPLPDDYPDDSCFFTVTFYFNESPPPPA